MNWKKWEPRLQVAKVLMMAAFLIIVVYLLLFGHVTIGW